MTRLRGGCGSGLPLAPRLRRPRILPQASRFLSAAFPQRPTSSRPATRMPTAQLRSRGARLPSTRPNHRRFLMPSVRMSWIMMEA